LATLFDFRQRVQTYCRLGVPAASFTRIFWIFGLKACFRLLLAWLTRLPICWVLPQISHIAIFIYLPSANSAKKRVVSSAQPAKLRQAQFWIISILQTASQISFQEYIITATGFSVARLFRCIFRRSISWSVSAVR